MTTHQMKLTTNPFQKIQSGKKNIESRLYDEKRRQIKLGDKIEFINTDDSSKKIITEVKALYNYPSFFDMFSDFPAEYFGGESKEALIKEIEQFYSKDDQKKFSVLGIKVVLI